LSRRGVRIHLPPALQILLSTAAVETVDARDLVGAIAALEARYPGLADRVMEPGGRPRPLVHVFVNDRRADPCDFAATDLAAGDEVWLIPAVAGG